MASLMKDRKTLRWFVQFDGRDGRRKTVRLGAMDQRQADRVKNFIEELVAARWSGGSVQPVTAQWLGNLPPLMHERLERAGLVEPRRRPESATLAEWVRTYIESRTDVKPGTRLNLEQTEKSLVACFPSKRLADFTPADAVDFRTFLKVDLAEATVRRRCKRARQFFHAAVKRRVLDVNPFAGVSCGDFANPARYRYVTREETEAILAKCPDAEWRAIVALARLGGLRCPSEVLALRWDDVDVARGRFIVRSVKTFDLAPEGSEFVITRYRSLEKNLRTQLRRIAKRAGVEAWPRTFANLRASAEADLAEKWPLHVCAQWLGHSPRVALTNYLRAREEDIRKAGGKGALQNQGERGAESGRKEPHGIRGALEKLADSLENSLECTGLDMVMVTPTGLEQPSLSTCKDNHLERTPAGGAARSAPRLPDDTRPGVHVKQETDEDLTRQLAEGPEAVRARLRAVLDAADAIATGLHQTAQERFRAPEYQEEPPAASGAPARPPR
jgi:integrase